MMPDKPWSYVTVDLLEIPYGHHLLVLVDYYSRWPEVCCLSRTTARDVIAALQRIFRTHGYPEVLRSDNGPPFASGEFETFLQDNNIEHLKGIPYWPLSNGEVEWFNRTLLKVIRVAEIEKNDWKEVVSDFLFHYRVTPQASTGQTPSFMLMGRNLRDKIPQANVEKDGPSKDDIVAIAKDHDAYAKMKSKEVADVKRKAKDSDILVGDIVLAKNMNRNKKTCPTFEPVPYTVLSKEGNAVTIQRSYGVQRMRNTAHLKKFLSPAATRFDPQVELADFPVPDSTPNPAPISTSSSEPWPPNNEPQALTPTSPSPATPHACPTPHLAQTTQSTK